MPINATFNASQFEPKQGGGGHPVGNGFSVTITNTAVKPTKDGSGGLFEVEFTTEGGSIVSRYNLFNQNAKAVEIANHEFSALCHAVGVMNVEFSNDGAVLRGTRGKLNVGYQKGNEPTPEKPEGGYVEVKLIMDAAGNTPGKPALAAAAPGQVYQPQQAAQAPQQAPAASWSNGAAQPTPTPNAAQQAPQTAQWAPGQAAAGQAPPWGGNK